MVDLKTIYIVILIPCTLNVWDRVATCSVIPVFKGISLLEDGCYKMSEGKLCFKVVSLLLVYTL